MNNCSTCLSFCPPSPPISAKTNSREAVVSGQLVFVHKKKDQTPSAGSSDDENISSDKTHISSVERLVFVNTAEISSQKNSELFQMPVPVNHLAEFQSPISNQKFQPPVQEDQAQAQAQALGAQERFQSPIPIKEAPGQVQSTSLTQKAQMLDQGQGWSQSVWDVPPSPPPKQIVFGVGFMPIQRPDGVPSSMNGVEISQSPSQDDNSNNNKSGFPSPAPNPQKPSGGKNGVSYLLV